MQYRFAPIYEWPDGYRLVRALDFETWKDGGLEICRKFLCKLNLDEYRWNATTMLLLFGRAPGSSSDELLSGLEIRHTLVAPRTLDLRPRCHRGHRLLCEGLFSEALLPPFRRGVLDVASATVENGMAGWMARGQRHRIRNAIEGGETEDSSMYALLGLPPPWLQKNEDFLPWWSEIDGEEWSPWG